MNQITIVLIVKNGQATIEKTLNAIKTWPDILVLDTGSTDGTLDIIKHFPHVVVKQCDFSGFGQSRNTAASYTKTPWVFHIDADEIPQSALLQELSLLSLNENCVYSIKRDNYFFGKHMKGCSGWYPDYVTRLYNKNKTSYSQDFVHEKVLDKGLKTIKLKASLIHTPYLNLKAMIDKMNHYSDLFVVNTKKKATPLSPYIHAFHSFFKSYILKMGFTQGYRGLILSKYIADTAFYKYLKLYEFQKKL